MAVKPLHLAVTERVAPLRLSAWLVRRRCVTSLRKRKPTLCCPWMCRPTSASTAALTHPSLAQHLWEKALTALMCLFARECSHSEIDHA